MPMNRSSGAKVPRARRRRLVVEQVADETLVYDLERHRAHCLSATAAWVWHRCDGATDVATLAARLGRKLGREADEEIVWVALHRLARAHLLNGPLPPARSRSLQSRRELVAKVAVFGISVLSIAAPAAGQAATCIMRAACEGMLNTNPRCAGQPCCDVPGKFCRSQGCGQNCCCHV
jgi:Coenzyme PQQ synthesis protein D (PqqD)